MPWVLVRRVTEVPLTVAVAVLMTLPVLLVVGVTPPPLPYLPPLLLVGVVPPVVAVAPDPLVVLPVVLPQAATRTTSTTNASILHQVRILMGEVKRVLCMMFSSFSCGDICNEHESCNDLLIYTHRGYKDVFDIRKDAYNEPGVGILRRVLSSVSDFFWLVSSLTTISRKRLPKLAPGVIACITLLPKGADVLALTRRNLS
jgi:hypothetical protein